MSLFAKEIDVNYCSFSKTGSDYNPDALLNPPPRLVPDDVNMTPANAQSFASILKIADGLSDHKFADTTIAQGKEGVLDICNGVSNIQVGATYGQGGTLGERIGSFKGGLNGITITGARNCSGTWADWIIGRWCDQSQAVDKNIDLSAMTGSVVIARGLVAYYFGNKNNIKLGNCKLLFWKSVLEFGAVYGKQLLNKL